MKRLTDPVIQMKIMKEVGNGQMGAIGNMKTGLTMVLGIFLIMVRGTAVMKIMPNSIMREVSQVFPMTELGMTLRLWLTPQYLSVSGNLTL